MLCFTCLCCVSSPFVPCGWTRSNCEIQSQAQFSDFRDNFGPAGESYSRSWPCKPTIRKTVRFSVRWIPYSNSIDRVVNFGKPSWDPVSSSPRQNSLSRLPDSLLDEAPNLHEQLPLDALIPPLLMFAAAAMCHLSLPICARVGQIARRLHMGRLISLGRPII